MDGNRRYAVKKGEPKVKGHEYGANTFSKIIEDAKKSNLIRELTFYTFSVQNFNRNQTEVDYIMKLFRKFLDKHISKLAKEDAKIKFLGRLELFPKDIQKKVKELEEKTKDKKEFQVNFCFGYGGREEIIDASKKLAEDVKEGKINPEDIDESLFENYLYTNHNPDIIIRTGGNIRTSNFLLWQTIYSEWFFLDKLWPEMTFGDIKDCIDQFNSRERRFGK